MKKVSVLLLCASLILLFSVLFSCFEKSDPYKDLSLDVEAVALDLRDTVKYVDDRSALTTRWSPVNVRLTTRQGSVYAAGARRRRRSRRGIMPTGRARRAAPLRKLNDDCLAAQDLRLVQRAIPSPSRRSGARQGGQIPYLLRIERCQRLAVGDQPLHRRQFGQVKAIKAIRAIGHL